jgi:peptidoglycan/xylan/chitin deacetylase (PgdA/CDA1 family)
VTCLLYHRICRHDDAPWLEAVGVPVTTPDAFDEQLRDLRRAGARFFTLEELQGGVWPSPDEIGIVVTFDDGFRDSIVAGAEILERHEAKGVFFVTSGMVERERLAWDHELFWDVRHPSGRRAVATEIEVRVGRRSAPGSEVRDALALLGHEECLSVLEAVHGQVPECTTHEALYPSWSELKRVAERGHEVGSHGRRHLMRHLLGRAEFLATELKESRETLEAGLGVPVRGFSYPFNRYLWGDESLCREAGYTRVATVNPGRMTAQGDWCCLPRVPIHGAHDRLSEFRRFVLE